MQLTATYKSFETERLNVKPVATTDAAFILHLLNTPKWLKNIGDRNVHSEEEAANYISQKMITQLERLGYGNNILVRKEDNAIVGVCGLYERPGLPVVDIGFALLEEYEGKGYAYEAASRLLKAGKEDFGIKKVCAITVQENIPSQKLLGKLGLQFIKLIRLEEDKDELMYYEKHL